MASIKSYSSSAPNLVGATTGGETPQQGLRRRHNFGDRMYKLSPEETPFFAYLSAVGKAPTDDPVFRVLEDRAPMKWADRSFQVDGGTNAITIEATEGGAWNQAVSGADIDVLGGAEKELVAGMLVQAVLYEDSIGGGASGDSAEIPAQVTARIKQVGTAADSSAASIQLDTVYMPGADKAMSAAFTLQVVGTAFGEGTGAPDSFGYDMDDTYGYTQIFKTAAHMSNTARATVLRGYASEWDRIWSLKLREHKVDIERAMLYNNKGRQNTSHTVGIPIQYTDGIIGSILLNAGAVSWDAALAYASKKPFVKVVDIAPSGTAANTEATYDSFLSDFEVIFAPERGGASEKFCMASLPVVTYFNKMKSGFASGSVDDKYSYNLNFSHAEGGLGHKVMKIDTVHGSISIVKNPLLKGIGKSMMVGVDLGCVSYRPLVGNGLNRDTYIETNVQSPDEDSRKDQILTEAGLEVCLPETHFLYQFVSNAVPIG